MILRTGSTEGIEGDLGVAVGNQVVALVVDNPHWYGRRPDGIHLPGQPVRVVLLQEGHDSARVEGELVYEPLSKNALRHDQMYRTEGHSHCFTDRVRLRIT